LKQYIEERAIEIANYIIESNATVRQTAKKFGISKSTVHKDVSYMRGFFLCSMLIIITFYQSIIPTKGVILS
jgi:putative DeoR family transcriptional regulator (stage III sporulation protein D)